MSVADPTYRRTYINSKNISDLASTILMKPKRISKIENFHHLLNFNGEGCTSQIFNFTKQNRYSSLGSHSERPERKLVTFLDNPELLRMEIECCLTS